jgi:hypothetical protein
MEAFPPMRGVVAGRINDAGRAEATDPDLRVLIEEAAEIGVASAFGEVTLACIKRKARPFGARSSSSTLPCVNDAPRSRAVGDGQK